MAVPGESTELTFAVSMPLFTQTFIYTNSLTYRYTHVKTFRWTHTQTHIQWGGESLAKNEWLRLMIFKKIFILFLFICLVASGSACSLWTLSL